MKPIYKYDRYYIKWKVGGSKVFNIYIGLFNNAVENRCEMRYTKKVLLSNLIHVIEENKCGKKWYWNWY